ncbi:MAG: type II secretion system protein GspK [Haliea sp.]
MAAECSRHPAKSRGMALVVVLWTVALLAILAGAFLHAMRTEVRMAHNLLSAVQARLLAEAGLNLALLELHRPEPAQRPRGDGSFHALEVDGDSVRYSVQDEAARVDLNAASAELLIGLLAALEVAPESRSVMVDTILDWRDSDSLRRLHGAEHADYLAAGYDYGAKNAPFDSVEELLMLPGMTPELFGRLVPFLTVYSGQPGIDAALASPLVVRALPGMSSERAAEYIAMRDMLHEIGQVPPLPGYVDQRNLASARGLVYTIRAEAVGTGGGSAAIEATIRLQREHGVQPLVILRWQETDVGQPVTDRGLVAAVGDGR